MNLIGTALERGEQNQLYVKFKKTVVEGKNLPADFDESYEWKCWMLKKYFKDNISVNLVRLVIGIVLLILAGSSSVFKILGNKGFGTIAVVICLCLGVICVGSGIMFSISNYRCLKNFKDYLWDEEGEIVEKIIKFYDKAH